MREIKIGLLLRWLPPLLVVGVCFGQTQLSLNEAIAQAVAGNPALSVSRNRILQAQGQQSQASLSPNPRLYLQSEDIRGWGSPPFSFTQSTEDYAYVGQIIEAGGKRARRVEVASSDVRDAELRNELLRRQIQARVSASYWTAAGTAKARDLYKSDLQTYEQDVTYIENRVKEGVTAEADLMRIQVERDQMRMRALSAQRDYEQALVELYRAMGRPDFPPTTLADTLESLPAVTLPEVSSALSNRVEVTIARQGITRAEANLRLQHANAKPDPDAYVGYKRDVGYDTLYAALQIDLPLRNRNQGSIASAEAEVRAAKANLLATETNVTADVVAARRGYRDQQNLMAQLPATRAKAQETARLARAAYREGGIDLLRLLDAERSRIEFEIQYYQMFVQFRQSAINLTYASGLEFQP